MDIDKLLLAIDLDLGTFQAHLKRMRKTGKELHRLDVELMQDKTRGIYDSLIQLEDMLSGSPEKDIRTINLPENMPEAAIPEKIESKKNEMAGNLIHPPKVEKAAEKGVEIEKPVEEVIPEKEKPAKVSEPEVKESPKAKEEPELKVEKPKIDEPKIEKAKNPPVQENIVKPKIQEQQPQDEAAEEKASSPKSTIDLFSDATEQSIGEKLGHADEPSIAHKIQSQKINSLKKAIGINEKFLFINELFGGDLGRYNNVVEEFEQMATAEGIATHLRELKVLNQWSDKNEAFLKFKSLVERKTR